MQEVLEVFFRIGLSIFILIILTRLDGSKQISQLSYYDYIIGITVGSIAGTLCIDTEVDIWHGVIGIVVFMLSGMLVTILTNKSIIARRVLTGVPIFLIANGEILYSGLKRGRFDINDLLRELRVQGYFNISEINYAILETNGHVSVMAKAFARPTNTSDFELNVSEDKLLANVVMDGKIMHGNLSAMKKDRGWLEAELKKQGTSRVKDVTLATLDEEGTLSAHLKNNKVNRRTSLI